jgi:hypothetical protein
MLNKDGNEDEFGSGSIAGWVQNGFEFVVVKGCGLDLWVWAWLTSVMIDHRQGVLQ